MVVFYERSMSSTNFTEAVYFNVFLRQPALNSPISASSYFKS